MPRAERLSTFLTFLVRSAECARIPRCLRKPRSSPPGRNRLPRPPGPVSLRGVGHSYGELRTIERLDLEVAAHGVLGLVGPSGCGKSTLLELIAGLREPERRGDRGRRRGRRPASGSRAAPTCRSATCCCPGSRRSTTRRWPCATAASGGPRRGARAGELFERFGLAGLRAGPAGRALGRDAPAGRLPAHPDRRQAGAAARRALRLARRDHPGRDAGVAGRRRSAPTRAPSCSSPTTSRRRSTSPTGSSVLSARPARVVDRS